MKSMFCLGVLLASASQATPISELEPRKVVFRHYHGKSGGVLAMLTVEGEIEFYDEKESNSFVPTTQIVLEPEIIALKEAISANRIVPEPVRDYHVLKEEATSNSITVIRYIDGKAVSSHALMEDDAFEDPVLGPKLVAIRRRFFLRGLEKWASGEYEIIYHRLIFDPKPEAYIFIYDKQGDRFFPARRPLYESNDFKEYPPVNHAMLNLFYEDVWLGHVKPQPVGEHIIIYHQYSAVLGPLSFRKIPLHNRPIDPEIGIIANGGIRKKCIEQFRGVIDPATDELIAYVVDEESFEIALIRNRSSGRYRWLQWITIKRNDEKTVWEKLADLVGKPGPARDEWKTQERLDPLIMPDTTQDDLMRNLDGYIANAVIVPTRFNESPYHPVIQYRKQFREFLVHNIEKKLPDVHDNPRFHPVVNAFFGRFFTQ